MADLHVSKKSIEKLLSEKQGKRFVIPDYQRPYKWTEEKCETLWNDIENFTNTDAKSGSNYFLGTVVSYTNDNGDQEIIDGQQRITSFFLLLRAFYKKLEGMVVDSQVTGLKNKIAPCIWDVDRMSDEVIDFATIHLISEVATEDDKQRLHEILETGIASETATDNYSVNYRFFHSQCNEYAAQFPMQWKELCITILQQCIILPIECDTSETALTIFSTLNDRGMPLSDSDIFKAQLYRDKEESKRKEFTGTWKQLTAICKQGDLAIDDVFRYYSHVLRGRNGDKSKEVGLRKFYSYDNYSRLKNDLVMDEIMQLAEFWRYINVDVEPESNNYEFGFEIRKYLQILSKYPNDFWKYVTSVFFLKNKNNENFKIIFGSFLQELISFLFAKFIMKPSVNAIKDDIYSSCISVTQSNELNYRTNINPIELEQNIKNHSSSRLSRALLLLHAYLHDGQKDLIPSNFDIEHIFPKKWQDTNYNGWDKVDADKYLDRFGNKIIFEKKLNIQAGNGYFGNKKDKYSNSKISVVKDLSMYPKNDWLKEDIVNRQESFVNDIMNFLESQTMETVYI